MNRFKKDPKAAPERGKETVGKTENFGSRNVKLITFLVCLGVLLALFIPVGVIGIDAVIDFLERDERPEMTVADVVALSEQEGALYLSDLTRFQGTLDEQTWELHYIIDIAPCYHLRAVADKDSQKLLYFTMLNLDTGASVNVLTDDVRAFVGN